jgi:hypothetical protein
MASEATRLGLPVALTREPIRWGDGTYIRALIGSLQQLAAEPWDWVLVLSGQDYPLRPLDELHRALAAGSASAYSPTTGRWPGPDAPEGLVERYAFRYWWSNRTWPRALRAIARRSAPAVSALSGGRVTIQPRPRGLGPGLGVRRRRTIFSDERPCHMGSDYVAMRRSAADALLRLLHEEPHVLDYFARTFVPSEALLASVLRWLDADGVADRNFHFMRFGGRANPRAITEDDLPELWDLGAIFGRKLTDDSTWVLDRLPMRGAPG